jgi:hypothetical protein
MRDYRVRYALEENYGVAELTESLPQCSKQAAKLDRCARQHQYASAVSCKNRELQVVNADRDLCQGLS